MNNENGDDLFMMKIHKKISAAIGGYNANQFLCLQIPGTILYADDYRYDVDGNGEKGAVVEANESRLANKMFDPCYLTGSDNGFSLAYQYKSALDILTPKINKDVADYKNELRQLLMSEYPYDFGDGVEKKYTLQEVYFRLYEDYIDELDKWSALQIAKKEELKKICSTIDEYNDEYLAWYELVAEKCLNEINEKKAKILSVFSPNDMKILEGVLDSGCGAELQETRQMVLNARKFTPNGGNVYPVRFVPANWFKLLGSSFTSADTMKSPEAIASALQNMSIRRMQLCSYIAELSSMICRRVNANEYVLVEQVKASVKALNENRENFKNVYENAKYKFFGNSDLKVFMVKNDNGIKDVLYAYCDAYQHLIGDLSARILENLVKKTFRNEDNSNALSAVSQFLLENIVDFECEHNNWMASTDVVVDDLKKLFEDPDNYPSKILYLKKMLDPVIKQYGEICAKIASTQESLDMSASIDSERNTSEFDMEIPKGYTQVSVVFSQQELDEIANEEKSSSISRSGSFGFIRNRVRFNTESRSESSSYEYKNESCEIRVSMNVAKVGIERDWFNPGIFALTKDMVKLGDSMIAPSKDYEEITDQRLKDMKDCIFPCYPVAMVIARDIKLVFSYNNSEKTQSEFVKMEKQSLSGGGILMFRGSNGNTSAKDSSLHVFRKDNSVVVNIDSTQLLGYYLETTHSDKSTVFGSEGTVDEEDVESSEHIGDVENVANVENDGSVKNIENAEKPVSDEKLESEQNVSKASENVSSKTEETVNSSSSGVTTVSNNASPAIKRLADNRLNIRGSRLDVELLRVEKKAAVAKPVQKTTSIMAFTKSFSKVLRNTNK